MLKNYDSFSLLEEYLSYLTVIKGRSLNTVIEYRTDITLDDKSGGCLCFLIGQSEHFIYMERRGRL
jgi:hypothetical protein